MIPSPLYYTLLIWIVMNVSVAKADILSPWKYIKQYHLGIEVGDTTDQVSLVFDNPQTSFNDSRVCTTSDDNPTIVNCKIDFEQRSSNYAIFLQQPFKRQGFWYINWDIGISLRNLSGTFKIQESLQTSTTVPVNEVKMNSYNFSINPYITLGITPKSFWPDLLLSLSPVVGEAIFGKIELDGETYDFSNGVFRRTAVLRLSTFEFDLVFVRFKEGYFSFHFSSITVDSHVTSFPRVLPDELNGLPDISEPDLEIRRSFFGLRLLFKR